MLKMFVCAAAVAATGAAAVAGGNRIEIVGGQTSVLLDTETLAAAASLTLSGVSDGVIAPGAIEGSVAFSINGRNAGAPLFPTTFAYNAADFFGTFHGAIEHEGSVLFNDGSVEVGNFRIGFDAGRVGALEGASGFFVESTVGIPAVLFDVALTGAVPGSVVFSASGDLLVSPEFGGFLFDNGLSASNLAGADVGDALIEGDAGCTGTDFDDRFGTNILDLIDFIDAWFDRAPEADFDASGEADIHDLGLFIRVWLDCRSFRLRH
ncbi:MAG: hypothetical protein AAGB51_03610 [Planctomycetota bacterium]